MSYALIAACCAARVGHTRLLCPRVGCLLRRSGRSTMGARPLLRFADPLCTCMLGIGERRWGGDCGWGSMLSEQANHHSRSWSAGHVIVGCHNTGFPHQRQKRSNQTQSSPVQHLAMLYIADELTLTRSAWIGPRSDPEQATSGDELYRWET